MSDTPYVRRNEDGTATLVLPEPCAESYLMSVELLRQFEQTHNDLIAERALADRLGEALMDHTVAQPGFGRLKADALVAWRKARKS